MGDKDNLTKQYISDNRIFADICNFYIYDGRQVIQPEQLHPLDSKELALLSSPSDKKEKLAIDKQRDVLKYLSAKTTDSTAYLILGIENQSDVHYAMPVRNMLYDALQYEHQMQEITKMHRNKKENDNFTSGFQKTDKLLPVITLVVYFGAKPWDGPMCLHDILQMESPALKQYVVDYPLYLIDPHRMDEQTLSQFTSSAREVFTFIKNAKDKNKILELVQEERFQHLDSLAADVINVCTKSNFEFHANEKEDVNMCQAMDEIREDSRNEGRIEGRNEGIEIGANNERKAMAIALLKDKIYPLNKIAALTKLSIEEIETLQREAMQTV